MLEAAIPEVGIHKWAWEISKNREEEIYPRILFTVELSGEQQFLVVRHCVVSVRYDYYDSKLTIEKVEIILFIPNKCMLKIKNGHFPST